MESADSMELKVISCKHLKAFNFFQKLVVYAVVSIISDESKNSNQKHQIQCLQRQKTPVDRDGNGNPEWNHQLQFDLRDISLADSANYYVKFSLRCEGIVFGNKTIGEVCVPLKELIDEFNRAVRFVSYQVRTTDGKPNGVLNFSYKLNIKGSDLPAVEAPEDEHLPYPSVEVEEFHAPKKDSCYPSVDVSTLPAISISTPYHTPEFHNMGPPQLPLPPPPPPAAVPMMMAGAYYHPLPCPLVYASQPYYDHGLCRYPSAAGAVGGVEGADGDGWRMGLGTIRDGFQGSWTFRHQRNQSMCMPTC
uniref:C2 domain-containing protein n=2 Tax=Vitis vinifera TaxID=29760 RepID=F6HJ81_VITVI